MKKLVISLCVLLLMLASFTAGTVYPRGDVDQNGVVDIKDVVTLIDYLLTETWPNDTVEPTDMTFTVNGVTFTMVAVEGGTFSMGATSEQGLGANDWERPVHYVTLSDFSIGQTEVTQELWQAVMGSNPSYYTSDSQLPVERVSWNSCQDFIEQLNQLTGETFRLPTEAEWEFAARGGNKSQKYRYSGSSNIQDVAWFWNSIPSQQVGTLGYGTQPVATKAPNELGLYDMSGNVWEWCQDWYGTYSSDDQINPTGPSWGSFRIFRGGSWSRSSESCRVAYRNYTYPSTSDDTMGFRLAL
jgi:formylglycine-generating enzyme required for sulfatase activity